MTKEQMHELADIIINKLIDKQKEYDEEFKSGIVELLEPVGFTLEEDDPLSKFKDNIKKIKIDDLKYRLKVAVESEDYNLATKIKEELRKLMAS
jgi:uncharacterized radical SAM superfamily protein